MVRSGQLQKLVDSFSLPHDSGVPGFGTAHGPGVTDFVQAQGTLSWDSSVAPFLATGSTGVDDGSNCALSASASPSWNSFAGSADASTGDADTSSIVSCPFATLANGSTGGGARTPRLCVDQLHSPQPVRPQPFRRTNLSISTRLPKPVKPTSCSEDWSTWLRSMSCCAREEPVQYITLHVHKGVPPLTVIKHDTVYDKIAFKTCNEDSSKNTMSANWNPLNVFTGGAAASNENASSARREADHGRLRRHGIIIGIKNGKEYIPMHNPVPNAHQEISIQYFDEHSNGWHWLCFKMHVVPGSVLHIELSSQHSSPLPMPDIADQNLEWAEPPEFTLRSPSSTFSRCSRSVQSTSVATAAVRPSSTRS